MYSGNIIADVGDVWKGAGQGQITGSGRLKVPLVGVAILTSNLQTLIPVQIFPPFNKEMSELYPPVRLQVPVGAQVLSTSFRLPSTRLPGFQYEWGRQLPDGCTIIGTTGDVLKVSTGVNNSTTAANTASVASTLNAYTPGTAVITSRPVGTGAADVAGGILTTVPSVWNLAIAIDNAANNAAGTGIRLSLAGATALIAVEIVYEINDSPIRYENVMLGGAGRSFYIR
jgi:hypothetical protein